MTDGMKWAVLVGIGVMAFFGLIAFMSMQEDSRSKDIKNASLVCDGKVKEFRYEYDANMRYVYPRYSCK